MANGATPAICVRGLTKDYGRGRGVFDVSLEVGVGEALGFLGPNGAGKTVTMRHLMGFIKPQKGTVQILGHDCFRERPQVQASLGYLPGENACMREMTARSFLDLMAGMRGMRDRSRMLELVDAFGLDLGVRIGGMSKGNRRRLRLWRRSWRARTCFCSTSHKRPRPAHAGAFPRPRGGGAGAGRCDSALLAHLRGGGGGRATGWRSSARGGLP